MSLQSVRRPVSDLTILAKVPVPGSPDWIAIGDDAIWISNIAKNNISRINPAMNKVVTNIAVGKAPCSGLGLGFGSVWVPCCGDARVDRIDVTTSKVVASIVTSVANSEGGIAVGPSGVWLPADRQGTVVHIDPTRNSIVGRVRQSTCPAVEQSRGAGRDRGRGGGKESLSRIPRAQAGDAGYKNHSLPSAMSAIKLIIAINALRTSSTSSRVIGCPLPQARAGLPLTMR
jgi:DNA-binding beta-propeller fold protein YncE